MAFQVQLVVLYAGRSLDAETTVAANKLPNDAMLELVSVLPLTKMLEGVFLPAAEVALERNLDGPVKQQISRQLAILMSV